MSEKKEETKLFALDLGNKGTKIMSEKATYVSPSRFYNKSTGSKKVFTNDAENSLKIEDFQLTNETGRYQWGPDVDLIATNNGLMDTTSFSDRYNHLAFKLLANFALAKLAADFPEAEKGFLPVNLVVGIPTDEYDTELVDSLVAVLKGTHSVKVGEKNVLVEVKGVVPLPQSVGTLYYAMKFMKLSNLNKQLVTVVDNGGGTVIIDTFKYFQFQENERVQLETGAFSLYRSIINSLNLAERPTEYQMEHILREGNKSKTYIYQPNANMKYDITKIAQEQIDAYTIQEVNNIQTTVKSLSYLDKLLFTGGGSNIITKKIITSEFKNAIFVDDSELANLRGFYAYGQEFDFKN